MIIHYDDDVDALYIQFCEKSPDGAVEVAEGIQMDLTSNNELVGIEVLDASKHIDLKSMLSYTFDPSIAKTRHSVGVAS